ncbi:MAG TPA: MFS transporter [Acetobacteraceae bacterium]|nr:MFS transporter [Acetobacteraceae bacterium]
MSTPTAAELAARLDRLPGSRHVWKLVILISLGACFEFYDLFLTAYVVPGMARAGLFTPQSLGVFGILAPLKVAGPGTFVFALFAGLWVGAMAFGWVADAYGRRFIFTFSLLWYSASTLIMAFQATGFGIDLWRFIAGIGIGIELVTIDTYVSELVPSHARGRAFAINQFIAFCAVPVVAFLAWALGPDNWRWVVVLGAIGAIFVWWLRRGVPESPRWLARRGRLAEADAVIAHIEAQVQAEQGVLPPIGVVPAAEEGDGGFAEIWQPPYAGRAVLLSVFNFFQTFGYYGFAAWVPTLLIAKGIGVTASLQYAFIIAIANPAGPLLCTLIADRMERKWQICCAAIGIGGFGMLFAWQTAPALLILFGVLVTLSNNWLSYSFHGYQAELFPTRIRARAVGFVYSWSRVSAALSGLAVGFFLTAGGVNAVFGFIAGAMVVVVVSIGGFGPRTRDLALEAISRA